MLGNMVLGSRADPSVASPHRLREALLAGRLALLGRSLIRHSSDTMPAHGPKVPKTIFPRLSLNICLSIIGREDLF